MRLWGRKPRRKMKATPARSGCIASSRNLLLELKFHAGTAETVEVEVTARSQNSQRVVASEGFSMISPCGRLQIGQSR